MAQVVLGVMVSDNFEGPGSARGLSLEACMLGSGRFHEVKTSGLGPGSRRRGWGGADRRKIHGTRTL